MKPVDTPRRDLLLIGGGHAHVQLIKMFAMQPEPGLRITVVSDVFFAPYSGMLPGYLAGIYTWHEVHFDLARICAKAGVRFVSGKAASVDPAGKTVRLESGATLAYDILSINIGSVPTLPDAIDRERTLAVKPISQFLEKWQKLLSQIHGTAGSANRIPPSQYAVVGGGAAGFEIALILQREVKGKHPDAQVHLFQAEARLLAGHPERLSRILHDKAHEAGLSLHPGQRVLSFQEGRITTSDQKTFPCDLAVWATQAAAPPLFRASGLATDGHGFLKVRRSLQAEHHDNIFAAGDCIAFPDPLPKSGVFAVREAGTLAGNIRSLLKGEAPRTYQPQKKQLSLITAGGKTAYASRGVYLGSGTFWWHVKDYIDRRFMHRWQDYPAATDHEAVSKVSEEGHTLNTCGGCGSKVGPATLRAVLDRTLQTQSQDLLIRSGERDDAVVTKPVTGERIVESVDMFRAFISDPFLTGKIAALHALSDLYAMGAKPFSAQILLQLPDMPPAMVERDMQLVIEGALSALRESDAVLSGGHTTTGPELQVGFAVLGTLPAEQPVLRKTGARPGDVLILTKPLGTGACLKAHMEGALRGDHLQEVITGMCQSNRIILDLGAQIPVHAVTDVTGFGLAGHLLEMFPGTDIGRLIDRSAVPEYKGFQSACKDGYETPLSSQIREHAGQLSGTGPKEWPAVWFDPQTSGGLIICTPPQHADPALTILKNAGFDAAAVIGRVQ